MIRETHRAYRVIRRIPEGEIGATLVLDGSLPAKPGEFVMVWLPGIEERPFSVMQANPLAITVARVGPFTKHLCMLRPGDRLWIRGPYGHGFPLEGKHPLLIGGGSGVASLTLLAQHATKLGPVHVIIGARSSAQLMLAWRFRSLRCHLSITTEDGSLGQRGTVLSALDPLLATHSFDGAYICGPEPMLRAVIERLSGRLPLWASLERVMKCGIGVCGHCHCGDQLVCRDGPVFEGSKALQLLSSSKNRG